MTSITTPPTKTPDSYELPQKVQATTLESVKFMDGMVVTADDLDAAMSYPADMLQTVLRSYLGCGLVCGMTMQRDPKAGSDGSYVLCIEPGLAIDCHGFPVELCNSIKLDLTPDPCFRLPDNGLDVCIAVRRMTSEEAPRDGCSCHTDEPQFQCSRTRNHILVKAFFEPDLAEIRGLCALPDPDVREQGKAGAKSSVSDSTDRGESEFDLCECLTECQSCEWSAESWVLLGCVTVTDNGISNPDGRRRRYVKPTQCLCEAQKMSQLQERVDRLEGVLASVTSQAPASSPVGTPRAEGSGPLP